MLRDALGPGVDFQPLFIDAANGVWCIRASFAPGIRIPTHLHTGPTHAFTLSGRWHYREHPDQPQTAGSYLFEPASSQTHQFETPADNTENTVVLFVVQGANVNFDDEGRFHSVMDAGFIHGLASQLAQQQGVAQQYRGYRAPSAEERVLSKG